MHLCEIALCNFATYFDARDQTFDLAFANDVTFLMLHFANDVTFLMLHFANDVTSWRRKQQYFFCSLSFILILRPVEQDYL